MAFYSITNLSSLKTGTNLKWFAPEGGQLRVQLRWLKDSTIIRPARRSLGGRLRSFGASSAK
jgi:hypothetical protein